MACRVAGQVHRCTTASAASPLQSAPLPPPAPSMTHRKKTWRDGRVFEGDWMHGKKNGRGKMTYPDGRVERLSVSQPGHHDARRRQVGEWHVAQRRVRGMRLRDANAGLRFHSTHQHFLLPPPAPQHVKRHYQQPPPDVSTCKRSHRSGSLVVAVCSRSALAPCQTHAPASLGVGQACALHK